MLITERYLEQQARWPQEGRHILAQYKEGVAHVLTPQERVYNPADPFLVGRLGLNAQIQA
jgi:hypothetical protein